MGVHLNFKLIFLFGFSEVNGLNPAYEAVCFGLAWKMLLDVASFKIVKDLLRLRFTKEGIYLNPAIFKNQVNLGVGPPITEQNHVEVPENAEYPYQGTKPFAQFGKSLLLENSSNGKTKGGTCAFDDVQILNFIFQVSL